MKRIRAPWLALIVLTAASCRTDQPRTTAAEPEKSQSIAATPIVPPASAAKSTPAVTTVKATPIVPAGGASAAQASEVSAAQAGSREERLKAVKTEFEQAMDAYYEPFRQAKTDEERQKIAETTTEPDAAPYSARARALVTEDATDTTAFDALSFLISHSADKEVLARDIALLERHHFGSERVLDALSMLQYSRSPAGVALLDRLAQESPHRNVRGSALMAQAEAQKNDLSMSAEIAEMQNGEERERYIAYAGQAEFDRLLALDRAQVETSILQLLETVARDYADVPASRKGVIGDAAKSAMHEMKNLVVGKVAPDIAGEDIAGVAFKLSDYRGKVVLLDFWGHW